METQGILLVNKQAGMTSHDVVNRVRRLYNTKKVGHTGTLDPMATGVLVVLVGRAVKAAEYLTCDDKRYEAVLRLGLRTDTEDTSGTTLSRSDSIPPSEEVFAAVSSFAGDIMQVPPMYSALKTGGQKLVELARRGITVPREARRIHIGHIEAVKLSDTDYILNVECSKGTYIRTLCADIGDALGCGGVMASLVRLRAGAFGIGDAYTLEQIEALDDGGRASLLHPTEELFSDLPTLCPQSFYLRLCKSGAELYQSKLKTSYPVGQRVRLYDEDGFFALGEVMEFEAGTAIKAIKLFRLD